MGKMLNNRGDVMVIIRLMFEKEVIT